MKSINVQDVKIAAAGRWPELISRLTHVPENVLDTEKHPCPICQGRDRFNACRKKFCETGQTFCNKCDLTGDGIQFIMRVNSWSFSETLQAIAIYVGMTTGVQPTLQQHQTQTTESNKTMSSPQEQNQQKPARRYDTVEEAAESLARGVTRGLHDGTTIVKKTIHEYGPKSTGECHYVSRFDLSDSGKSVRQMSGTEGAIYRRGLTSGIPLLYHSKLAGADTVVVAEGEKCVDALCGQGVVATTSAGGSKAARKSDWSSLDDKQVAVFADNDPAGLKYAEDAAARIRQQAPNATVRIIHLPEYFSGMEEGQDIADVIEGWNEDESGPVADAIQAILDDPTSGMVVSNDDSNPELPDVSEFKEYIPLNDRELPPLNVKSLTPQFGEAVQTLAAATETNPEMATLQMLAATSSTVSQKYEVEVELGYTQPGNLYVVSIGEPGGRKSAVKRGADQPVHDFERNQQTPIEHGTSSESGTPHVDDVPLSDDLFSEDTLDDSEWCLDGPAVNLREASAATLVSDDSTAEALATQTSKNHHRMYITSAEPDAWDSMCGRYSSVPNLGIYLKGHEGDSFRVDRQGRTEPIVMPKPLLTIGIMAQPDAVAHATGRRAIRGRGLFERFLYFWVPSNLGRRRLQPLTREEQDLSDYNNRLTALLEVPYMLDESEMPVPRVLPLSAEAYQCWKKFQRDVETKLAEGGELSSIRGWGSKLPGNVARIALISALYEGGPQITEVDLQSMASAVSIGHCLMPHAVSALNTVRQDTVRIAAENTVNEIHREAPTQVTRRDVMRKNRNLNVEQADRVLWLLEEHGYLARAFEAVKPGRPSLKYNVRPGLA